MKKLLFSILLISALFSRELPFPWVVYEDQIRYYLDSRSYEIDGKFYSYDFDNNGKIDYNDWIYISKSGSIYRLFGTETSYENKFGWQEIKLPQDFEIKGNFQGYYIFIDYPNDKEKIYSWIYVNKNKNIYKLMGKKRLTNLSFTHIQNLKAFIKENKILFALPLPQENGKVSYKDALLLPRDLGSYYIGYQKPIGCWQEIYSKDIEYSDEHHLKQIIEEFKSKIDNRMEELQSRQENFYELLQNDRIFFDSQTGKYAHKNKTMKFTNIYVKNDSIKALDIGDRVYFSIASMYKGCIVINEIPSVQLAINDILSTLHLFCKISKEP